MIYTIRHIMFLAVFSLVLQTAEAQYFGQNKPRYSRFDFKVYESPHFAFYSYLNNQEKMQQVADWTEQWYNLHAQVLKDTFSAKNPIILYNHHADFQQTNTIMGQIGQGTGGVTEGFKTRVVIPMMMTNKGTHHVLGHELVHAFQYRMVTGGDSTSLRNMGMMPLWLIEGLAEYLSIGRTDAHTALWMRDAYIHNRIPKLKDLNDPKYFPYRYGQTFWSFLTGTFGDQIIEPFFMASAQHGIEQAVPMVLGMDLDSLSVIWQRSMNNHYARIVPEKKSTTIGKPILTDANAGDMNLSPVLSPDGRFLIFVSEKDLFSMDMYLAEARGGKILRKIASSAKEGHIDDFSIIESSATWSPKSDRFAFVATRKGRNILVIKDVDRGRTIEEIAVPGIEAINYPSWSPDGSRIAFTGMVQGISDIYTYDLRTKNVVQITQGPASEIMPAWSVDGKELVFSTDYLDAEKGGFPQSWGFNLAMVDATTLARTDLDIFPAAENLNPQFDGNGNILFLSNRDGFRNIYRYSRNENQLVQLTDLATGVSGITQYSPALTVSAKRDRLLFTQYTDGKYQIYMADLDKLSAVVVNPKDVDFEAAILPVSGKEVVERVNQNMNIAAKGQPENIALVQKPFRSKFRLDYLGGGGGMGVGTGNNTFGSGTALIGGVDMLFTDILGNHQIYSTLMLNGEISDIGGQVQYLNQKYPIGWGVRLLHIPIRSGVSYYAGLDSVLVDDQLVLAEKVHTDLQRVFRSQAGLFAQYPFSPFQRVEVSTNYMHFGFREDRYVDYYYQGLYLGQNRERLPSPDAFNLYSFGGAYVGDRADWGIASPLKGYRFRLGMEQYVGEFNFSEITADGRRYFWMRPLTLAFRGLYFGRHGGDANIFQPMYIGDPTLVRGYSGKTFDRLVDYGLNIEQLIGSKLMVANMELRLPFTGPKKLALISSSFLFTDLNLFLDGGLAFQDFNQVGNQESDTSPIPVFSAGVSVRVNLFGALILEPYYAWPLQRDSKGVFGLNFIPGF